MALRLCWPVFCERWVDRVIAATGTLLMVMGLAMLLLFGRMLFDVPARSFAALSGLLLISMLRRRRADVELRIAAMKGEIANLKDDLNKFKTDPYYLEKVARNELGLAKDNEVIVNIEEKDHEGMD
jgi:cell division protein FtsB